MAHLDEKNLRIILSVDDEEAFRESMHKVLNKQTPVADRIIKKIKGDK